MSRATWFDLLDTASFVVNADLPVLKNYDKPEDLALNFTLTEEEFGVPKTIDLVPGGSDIAVTAENRHECTDHLASPQQPALLTKFLILFQQVVSSR